MVGSEDHDGIIEQMILFQCFDNASYIFVYPCDAGIVIADVVTEVVSHFRAFCRNIRTVFAESFYIQIFIYLFVSVRYQFVSRVGRIH